MSPRRNPNPEVRTGRHVVHHLHVHVHARFDPARFPEDVQEDVHIAVLDDFLTSMASTAQ